MRCLATCALIAACNDPKLNDKDTVPAEDTATPFDTASPDSGDRDGGGVIVVGEPEGDDSEEDAPEGSGDSQEEPGGGDELGPACPPVLGFSVDAAGAAIRAGADLSDAYRAYGVSISTDSKRPIAFDSSAPTGGDSDLGTPNADFGGPGVGGGGGLGELGENSAGQGGLLILAEDTVDADGDGLVDDPDDNAGGGAVTLAFDEAMCVFGLRLIDIESDEDGTVTLLDADGLVLASHSAAGWGNNSAELLALDGICGVHSATVSLSSSGGIDDVDLCPESALP